ncbi:acyl-CoA dehydrogenase family protein [Sandaracinus amylolyticus]|uniref:acyl-CoA dehydrogenase family protein n=1 Tax=Sandaracinus amylolyticus TaxID=927083 RepID=UPI001F3DEFA9|nr:acyl-CoA dehydrogenase family protein [Sandaracinus amylolyticus]UJR78460.1 Acyl-CoA dehydrogenase, middle domain [Sandaracinus amylolyticus]
MLHEVMTRVLRPLDPPLAFERASDWWEDHLEATRYFERPVDRAIAGAARVDRLGFAFAGGYAAALRALVPDLPADAPASLAATEQGGAHPRAIETTLTREGDGWTLSGRKNWVTLGAPGRTDGLVLVIARLAKPSGDRPELRLVRVAASAPGVTITALGEMPFVPEIPHAALALEGVRVRDEDVLPGDGYDQYLKPFRTVEDLHVHAAALAWLLAIGARARWPHEVREQMLAALIATRSLTEADPSAPETHVAVGGVIAATRGVIEACEPCWTSVDDATRARWVRDRAIFGVASKARTQRLASAWTRLEGEPIRGA